MNARQIRHFIGKIALLLITATEGFSQSSSALFSDSILSRVKVWINPDSLNWLHANPTSNVYLMADMVYEDGLWSDTIRKIGFRLRGNTSRFSKKKSYKISFNTFSSGRRYQGVKKINLNGQHNDPTMIREKLFYHLWNKAGMPARRTVFVKLFINNLYMGLYTGLEEFDKDWLQRVMGNNSGNLYKCTYPADLIYLGPDQNAYKSIQSSSSTGGRAYSLETNEVEDDYSGFVQLCARLQDPVTASFPQNIESILNIDRFLKAYAMELECGHWDDYGMNKNNYFLYHNPSSGQFDFISYDADNTFGVDWFNINWSNHHLNHWINPNQPRPLVKKVLSYQPYRNRFLSVLDSINRMVMHPDSCFPWIDWAKNHIAAAAEADSFRTLDYGYSTGDFYAGFTEPVDSHTPIGIKPFLQNRYNATLAQLSVLSVGDNLQNSEASPFPNPFQNMISIPRIGQTDLLIQIVDMLGRDVSDLVSKKQSGEFLQLNFSSLPKGLYRIALELKDGKRRCFSVSSE